LGNLPLIKGVYMKAETFISIAKDFIKHMEATQKEEIELRYRERDSSLATYILTRALQEDRDIIVRRFIHELNEVK